MDKEREKVTATLSWNLNDLKTFKSAKLKVFPHNLYKKYNIK